MSRRTSGRPAGPILAILSVLIVSFAACGGGAADCTTCPSPDDDGALRLQIQFDAAARSGMDPAGFRLQDLDRVDLQVAGTSESRELSLDPGQDRAFLSLIPGSYAITATAFGESDLVLFTAADKVTIFEGDTAETTLAMKPELGKVTLTIDGETSGTVEAVAGLEGLPFTVTVRNSQGQPVPGSTIGLKTADFDFGQVLFEGGNATNPQGRVTGTIRAAHSGVVELTLSVDDRPVADPGPTRIEFATGVVAANSRITHLSPTGQLIFSDGQQRYEFTVVVQDARGNPLPGVPVNPESDRNIGVDPNVDIIVPAQGFESGTTDATGTFRFRVRTFTSSFLRLDEQGRLFSPPMAHFVPSTIIVLADGVQIDQRQLTFNSTVNSSAGEFTVTDQFVTANGQDSTVLVVRAREIRSLGGDPVANKFVELTNVLDELLNYELDIVPEPGFTGFRTNASGEWRGRLRSNQSQILSLEAKVDGRALNVNTLNIVFQ